MLSQITKLKIDSNPFAKGFRDSSRLSDFERETMESMMECQMIQRQPHHPHPQPGPGHPGHHARPQIGLGMFRPPAPTPPEPQSPSPVSLSSEERALFLARTQLLRAQSPFPGSPASPFSAPPLRPPLSPHLGLQHLWAQWAQLQHLSSALVTPHSAAAGQPPAPSPATLFSSLLSQAQRFSPYVISSPSPPPSAEADPDENMSPSSSRSQSPVQVEA